MPDEVRTLQVAIAEGVEAKLAEAGVDIEVTLHSVDIREVIEELVVAWTAARLEPYVRAPASIIPEIWPPGTPLYDEARNLISTNALARRVLTGGMRKFAGIVVQGLDLIDGEDDF